MQTTSKVFMVRPVRFAYNKETAASNAFQHNIEDACNIQEKALNEFDSFVAQLRQQDIEVIVFNDTLDPFTPDSIFPNNWITTHADGKIILYPMEAVIRRKERRSDIIDYLLNSSGGSSLIDLTYLENEKLYLEGTGSLVLDRVNKIAYACLSSRTSPVALNEFEITTKYTTIRFSATDDSGLPIYHTNVLMSIGSALAVICLEAIKSHAERRTVVKSLESTGKKIVPISFDQMKAFAGNILELISKEGRIILVLSKSAYDILRPDQLTILGDYAYLLPADIKTIEQIGGGSARCMIAEIF